MFHNNKGKYHPYNLNPRLYLYAFNHADFTHVFISLQKLEYLEDANKILSDSINVDSDRNWFAYTTRMHVRLDIADIVIERNRKKATHYIYPFTSNCVMKLVSTSLLYCKL
jgi:hypothetical protein